MIDPLKHAKRHTFQPSGSRAPRPETSAPVPPVDESFLEPVNTPPREPNESAYDPEILAMQANRTFDELSKLSEAARNAELAVMQAMAPDLYALVAVRLADPSLVPELTHPCPTAEQCMDAAKERWVATAEQPVAEEASAVPAEPSPATPVAELAAELVVDEQPAAEPVVPQPASPAVAETVSGKKRRR